MEVLYVLIPLSLIAMFGVIGVFAWALHNDQFDDLEAEADRALQLSDGLRAGPSRAESVAGGNGAAAVQAAFDADQACAAHAREQSSP